MPITTPSDEQLSSAAQHELDQWRYSLDTETRERAQAESHRRLAETLEA